MSDRSIYYIFKTNATPIAAFEFDDSIVVTRSGINLGFDSMLQTLAVNAPNIDGTTALNTRASQLQQVFSGADLVHVLDAYVVGIKVVSAFCLAS